MVGVRAETVACSGDERAALLPASGGSSNRRVGGYAAVVIGA